MSQGRASHRAAILEPPLPFRMGDRIDRAVTDVQLQQFVNSATRLKEQARLDACARAFGEKYDRLRTLAGEIRQHTLDHLDFYLAQFIERAEAAGALVHVADDAATARAIVLEIARGSKSTRCVKSKSMVTEEIDLVPAMEAAGIETLETDLGEFIVQLDDDAPSHIVTPMIHKDRQSAGRTFERQLGTRYTDDPRELTMIARRYLREKYQQADLGISGANFLLADSGTIVICTNEGNADLSVSAPPVHIAVTGIEKVIPGAAHLPIFLKLLARSATGQELTVYTTLIHGPRRQGECGGADELHIVLVDNGRSAILRGESRELLRCIRCGACLNACPVYRKAGGGHAYGAVYSGPIGAILTPHLKGVENYPDLPRASSLCGACFEACPVKIDIPRHLIRLREMLVARGAVRRSERVAMVLWARMLETPARYTRGVRMLRRLIRLCPGARSGSTERRWVRRLPGGLSAWTRERDFPAPAKMTFREWWDQHRGGRA